MLKRPSCFAKLAGRGSPVKLPPHPYICRSNPNGEQPIITTFARTDRMAFGWSFPKLMVAVSVAFLLFGVPIMTFIMVLMERRRKRKE